MRMRAVLFIWGIVSAVALSSCGNPEQKKEEAAAPAKAPAVEVKKSPSRPSPPMDEAAIAEIRTMSDKLKEAQAFSFQSRSMVEVPSPSGQLLHYFANSKVSVSRPNKLRVFYGGDSPAFDLFFDGSNMSVWDPKAKFFARTEGAAATLDEFIPLALQKAGIYLPYADFLMTDPAAGFTKDLKGIYAAGQGVVDGKLCNHLVGVAEDGDFELWIGVEDKLPYRLVVEYTKQKDSPTFMVELSGWNLKAALPAATFEFKPPPGGVQVEFKVVGVVPEKR